MSAHASTSQLSSDDHLIDLARPSTSSLESIAQDSAPSSSRILPTSPKPRLMMDPISPSGPGAAGAIGENSVSAIMTLDDYKRLNIRTQQIGMASGIGGGGVFTYMIRQYAPKRPSKNALFMTFLLSSTFISYFTSHTLLVKEIARVRALVAHSRLPQAPDGGGVILPDTSASGDSPIKFDTPEQKTGGVWDELKTLGKKKDRTRWSKGKGLEGEVEEEGEMRDTWYRPGVPRREV